MLTFQVESWVKALPEMEPIFPLHYEELSLDKDWAKMALNFPLYEKAEKDGYLLLCTVRADGRLVGYIVSALLPHTHYKEAGTMSMTDMYYVLPKFRKGGCGAKLLHYMESVLREKKITKIYLSTKLHENHSELLQAMGYRPTDLMLTKRLV